MGFELRSARWLAAECLTALIRPGDTVVDATMGNGHDTEMLARLVGEGGRVYTFDVQSAALESTAALLEKNGLSDRCTLILFGHEHMAGHVAGPVRAVVFNLGWLPGSDKCIRTHWETTRTAVEAALSLLCPGGCVTICAYPGHEEGDFERRQLGTWLSLLRPQEYNVLHQCFLNAGPGAPECFIIQRQPVPASG